MQFGSDWLLSRQRVRETSFQRVWKKANNMMTKASSKPNANQMLRVLFKRLARLVDKATMHREHPPSIRRIASIPAPDSKEPTSPGEPSSRVEHILDEAPAAVHNYGQWIPPILVRISKSVAEKHSAESAFARSMQKLLNTMLRINPYSYMLVIYSPPPPELLATDEGGTRWRVQQSSNLQEITAKLMPNISKLRRHAYWLDNPQKMVWPHYNFGWQQLHSMMMLVHEVAAQFHVVVLYLYSVAMGRENYSIDMEAQVSDLLLRLDENGRYGLPEYTAVAKDHLERESYAFCPEVLVYLDAWRNELPFYEHGFAPREKSRSYLVNFSVRKSAYPTRLSRVAHHLYEIYDTWKKTLLGSTAFKSMHIQEIGELEKTMKKRLGSVIDYFYEQNIAKWTQRREMESPLPLVFPNLSKPLQAMPSENGAALSAEPVIGKTVEAAKTVELEHWQAEVVQEEQHAIEQAENGFRKPGVLRMDRDKQDKAQSESKAGSSAKSNANEDAEEELLPSSAQPLHGPVELPEICAWTDAEIDVHEQEMERIYALQSRLAMLHDQADFQRVMVDVEKKPLLDYPNEDFYIDKKRSTLQLLQTCAQLRSTVATAAAFGEEIALHGAAEALIQRPSLRKVPASPLADESDEDSSEAEREKHEQSLFEAEMHQILREARARVDSIACVYDGVRSSESHDLVQVISRSSKELLALASGQQLAPETIEPNESGGS